MPQGTRTQDPKYGDWSGTRQSMSWGVFPSRKDFNRAFDEEVPGLRYRIRNDSIVGDDDFTASELWALCRKLKRRADRGNDAAGDLASAIMESLGFEWI